MTFEEVYQQIRKMHYEILDERESISKSARLSLSTWMLDILTEYRDEWCDDCKRFNTVIRETLNREPSEDGTLEVKVEDATKVGRVLISDDKHRGGLYYPDEDEPQGDLISRADAIEALSADTVQGWIPCYERLPEAEDMYQPPDQRYLCQLEAYGERKFCVLSRLKGAISPFWDWYGVAVHDSEVTAWMPLPEPYKERRTDE